MTADAWDPFDKLRDRIKEAVSTLGVDFVGWAILPGTEDGEPKMCQVVFGLTANTFAMLAEEERKASQTDEERMIDAQFAAIAAADRQQELDAKRQATKEGLLKLSKGGILDEDEDEADDTPNYYHEEGGEQS